MTFAYEEVSDDDRKELDFFEGSLCAIEGDFQRTEFQSVMQELTQKVAEKQKSRKPIPLGRLTPTRYGGGGKGGDSSRPRLRLTLVHRACLRLPLPKKGFRNTRVHMDVATSPEFVSVIRIGGALTGLKPLGKAIDPQGVLTSRIYQIRRRERRVPSAWNRSTTILLYKKETRRFRAIGSSSPCRMHCTLVYAVVWAKRHALWATEASAISG